MPVGRSRNADRSSPPTAFAATRGAIQRSRRVTSAERSHGDGIAQGVDRRDAVLPDITSGTPQQIDRARLDDEGDPFPRFAGAAPKSKSGGRRERHTEDVPEYRAVLVPADRRSGTVFDDGHLFQGFGLEVRE